jgi:hypothetical protein
VAPACDLVVAAERACFLLAFVNLGLCHDLGSVDVAKGSQLLRKSARPGALAGDRRRVCLQLFDEPQFAHASAAEV